MTDSANNVVKLELITVGEHYRFDANTILDAAKEQGFSKFLLIGEYADVDERDDDSLYVAGNANLGETLVLLEWAKLQLIGR